MSTPIAKTIIPELPDAGPDRFWHATHQPSNVKFPMLLELRQKTVGDTIRVKFSTLIAKQPVIADPKSIVEAAHDILVRAGKVDEFVGVLSSGPSS